MDLKLNYSRTLSQEVFKHMCFKQFKEPKYYYDRSSANENESSFFLNDRYFIFYERKMTGVNKIYERNMSKLDVFLWISVKCYGAVSTKRY